MASEETKEAVPTWVRACARPARGFYSAQLWFPPTEIYRLMPSLEKANEVCVEELIVGSIVEAENVPKGWHPDGTFDASTPTAPAAEPNHIEPSTDLPRGEREDASGEDEVDPSTVVTPKPAKPGKR